MCLKGIVYICDSFKIVGPSKEYGCIITRKKISTVLVVCKLTAKLSIYDQRVALKTYNHITGNEIYCSGQ